MALAAKAVSVRFGGLHAIEDVSLALAPGEILGLIGPNGAGKTTLVNVLTGFQRPHAGTVAIDGRAGRPLRPAAFARAGVVRTFQAVRLFPRLSVSENVEVACVSAGMSRSGAREQAQAMLDFFGLGARADLAADALNYGDERRVGLARALALKPRYLLLDEPAAGLNAGEADQLRQQIADIRRIFGCGILLIEHNMTLIAAICERLHVLATGRTLATGTTADVMANPAVRSAYLGVAAA